MKSAVTYFRALRVADRLLSRFAAEFPDDCRLTASRVARRFLMSRRLSRFSGLSGPAALPRCLSPSEHQTRNRTPQYLSSEQVGYIIANQYFNRPANYSVRRMESRWSASTLYQLRKVPAWVVTPYRRIRPGAKSKSTGPIIIDLKKDDFDHRYGSFGQNMDIVCLDGKHRLQEHKKEFGDGDIDAYVGIDAIPIIDDYLKDFAPKREAFVAALEDYYGDPDSEHWHTLIKTARAAGVASGWLRYLWHKFRDGQVFSPVMGKFVRRQ